MKNLTIIAVLTVVVAFISTAQDRQSNLNQIIVLGSVELKEVADQASFTFSAKGVGSSLRLAVEDANKKVKVVTDKLLQLGIPGVNISTSRFYSGENYGDKAFLSSSRDYQATLTTLVKVDSLPLLESVLYLVSESEVVNLSNIEFSLKDELKARRQARVGAAMKAKEKAEDMTRPLGVGVGKLLFLEETEPTRVYSQSAAAAPNPFNPTSNQLQFRSGRSEEAVAIDESSGSGFFAQTILVTSQVRAVFEIKELH